MAIAWANLSHFGPFWTTLRCFHPKIWSPNIALKILWAFILKRPIYTLSRTCLSSYLRTRGSPKKWKKRTKSKSCRKREAIDSFCRTIFEVYKCVKGILKSPKMLQTFFSKTVQLKRDVSVQHPNASEYTQTIIGWKLTKFAVLQKNINVLYSLQLVFGGWVG